MQYNSDSDSQDIVSAIGDATGLNTTVDIKQITRAANQANKQIWSWIFSSYGGWQYDDSNNGDLPVALATLEADQQKYTLPSTALAVRGLEYKNAGGDWVKLHPVPIERLNQFVSENEWNDTPSEPQWYSLLNGIIKLYPASDTKRTEGLRIQFDRGATTFASTDTTKTPGFATEFHEAVAVGASYIIARNKSLPNLQLLQADWIDYERRIKEFYVQRWDEQFPPKFETGDTLKQYI